MSDKDSKGELKPCPFCGGSGQVELFGLKSICPPCNGSGKGVVE